MKEVLTEATTVTISSLITEAGTGITAAMGVTWDLMTANPLLTLFVGAGIISMGFTYFRKAKRAAR